jgi:hypothetical protein
VTAKGILLTYNAPNPGDGAGAQVQRILGIYSAARSNNLGYLHTQVSHLGANAGDGFDSVHDRQKFTEQLNKLIALNSDQFFKKHWELKLKRINPRLYWILRPSRRILELIKVSLILRIDSSLQWVDQNVWCYDFAVGELYERFVLPRSNESRLIVDIHIRRAGIPMQDLLGHDYGRWTPTHWYDKILKEIYDESNVLNQKLLIRVHTDTLSQGSTWNPPTDISPETVKHWKDIGVLSSEGSVVSLFEDFSTLFSKYGDVEVIQDIDAITAWKMMIQSDILIIAKSSMSYAAALFRIQKPVIFQEFWHSGLANWLAVATGKILSQSEKDEVVKRTRIAIKQKISLTS